MAKNNEAIQEWWEGLSPVARSKWRQRYREATSTTSSANSLASDLVISKWAWDMKERHDGSL